MKVTRIIYASTYTPYREIKRILLSRSPAQLSVNWAELQTASAACQPAADKPIAHIRTRF